MTVRLIVRRGYKQIKNKEDAIKLQQDLDAAGKWEQDWLMHFHLDKCTVVSVTQKRKTKSHTYQLHGHTLKKADFAKYLGITIQNNLKWDKHINDVMFIKDLSMLPQCNVTLEMYDHVYCMLVA